MRELSLHRVSYTYQGKYQKVNACKEISCTFETGKLYAIIGQSGSGKTTLLSLMAGLGIPTSGSIFVDGEILQSIELDQYRRDHVSIIYQSFHLFPSLTVLENVCFPMQLDHHKQSNIQKKASELLQSVGIPKEYERKFPSMLSGGEQQRVAIARALASKATFLLADEPTGNLDREHKDQIMELFHALVKKGYCVIIVTHDLQIAKVADVVYEMCDGSLQKQR